MLGAVSVSLSACADDGGPSAPDAQAADLRKRVQAASPASGSLRGGTRVTLRGIGLGQVTSVLIGGEEAPLVQASATSVVVVAPASVDYRPGSAQVRLRDAKGATVATTAWRYRAVDGVDRQLQYLLTYWKDYNPAYQPLGTTDCVDFASQSLLQRGWQQQGAWVHAEDVYHSGAAWVSSTAFRDFMVAHPELGEALTDDQRDRVKLGDVVQFDWDRSGDRDHTGVVTRITRDGDSTRIFFAGHTKDSDYRSVDDSITTDHPGGIAHYWSLR